MFYHFLKYVVIGPILRLFFRPWVEGMENIPVEGPAILASNHLSFSDSFFLPLMVPRRITFLAKADYFTGRGLKGWFSRAFFTSIGQVPIDRSGGRASGSASTPRAPARRTPGSTVARPASPGWRSKPESRSSRSR